MAFYALFALWIVLQLVDIASTERAFRLGGREANPIMAWLMSKLGRPVTYLIKLAIAVPIGWFFGKLHIAALAAGCVLGLLVCVHNLRLFRG